MKVLDWLAGQPGEDWQARWVASGADSQPRTWPHYTPGRPGHRHVYIEAPLVYTDLVAKHLIDIDERALDMARAELGTTTIKETVNAALRLATSHRAQRVAAALDLLAAAPSDDRAAAWR